MPQFPNLIHFAIPFFVISILLELYIAKKQHLNTYEIKDALTSISMGIGNVIIGFVSKALVLVALYYVYENFRFFTKCYGVKYVKTYRIIKITPLLHPTCPHYMKKCYRTSLCDVLFKSYAKIQLCRKFKMADKIGEIKLHFVM